MSAILYKMVYFAQWPKRVFIEIFGKIMLLYWEFHPHTSTSQKRGWLGLGGILMEDTESWEHRTGARDTWSRQRKNCAGAPKFKMPGIEEGGSQTCV